MAFPESASPANHAVQLSQKALELATPRFPGDVPRSELALYLWREAAKLGDENAGINADLATAWLADQPRNGFFKNEKLEQEAARKLRVLADDLHIGPKIPNAIKHLLLQWQYSPIVDLHQWVLDRLARTSGTDPAQLAPLAVLAAIGETIEQADFRYLEQKTPTVDVLQGTAPSHARCEKNGTTMQNEGFYFFARKVNHECHSQSVTNVR